MLTSLGWVLAGAVSLGAAVLFIPRELWKRWRTRIVDRLDVALRRRVSRFDRRYREFLLSSLRFINLKGLATVGYYTPELDDVFVDVSLAYRAPHQVPQSLLAQVPPDVTDRHSIMEFLAHRERPVVLAVLGVPGSGKTTLLRHTARVICRGRGNRRSVPILLHLRDHAAAIVATPEVGLPSLVRGTLGRHATDEPPGWFEQRLRDGDCVVLLDGLDEVASQTDRRKVADWVERQTREYPRNDFVITSRPHGYRTSGVDGAVVLQVRSFTDEQVRGFVRGWYLAVEKHGATAGEEVRERAESAADDLLERLNRAPGLYDLTVNPLLLTMIANVHRYRGALPGSRVELYREICEAMLWRRQEAKNLATGLSGDKKEALLRGLAFTMMESHVRDLPGSRIVTHLRPALRRMSRKLTAENFLADVSSNGLLIERETGKYSFAHHTFQEYLAAMHIRDKGLAQLLADAVDDLWWRETTLLYAARSDADPIVRSCLNSDSVTALSLAFDCAAHCGELAPALRDRLDELLASCLGPQADPERRRLMVGVLLTRHLSHQVPTSSGARVCVKPITTEIYRLYQQDTLAPPLERPEPDPSAPATGVRQAGAISFVQWVNKRVGTSYRLPSWEEITDPAVQRSLTNSSHSIWLRSEPDPGWSRLWTPPDEAHPHAVNRATITDHVDADIHCSTATLIRLLLLRSAQATKDIATDLDRMSHKADALTYELAMARYLARDTRLHNGIAGAQALARDLVWNLGSDHALARASAQDLTVALRRLEALDRADAHSRPLDRTLALDREWVPEFAMANAAQVTLRKKPRVGGWVTAVAEAFVELIRLGDLTYLISPDKIAELAGTTETSDTRFFPSTRGWLAEVSRRINVAVTSVIDQGEPMSRETATTIRLSALCLAVMVNPEAPGSTRFGNIAACVTLLERRATGQAPVTETIMLASA